MRKDAPGKIFECLRGKIMSIREYYYTNVKLPKNMIEKRFQIRNTVMKLDNANKLYFEELNGKRCYFSGQTVFFSHMGIHY